MAESFEDRKTALYYSSIQDLPTIARDLIADSKVRSTVAADSQALVLGRHTYIHRAHAVLEALSLA